MKRLKPTVAMKGAAKEGIELINSGAFPVTARAKEIGKKIASGQDLDEDHVTDMAHFHASHKCPGDCEDLLWGGPAGGDWARNKLMQNMRTGFAEENLDFDKIMSDKDLNLSLEIYSDIQLDEPSEETDDGLIWAPIARSGMLATRPGPNGEKLDQPLVFIPGHSEDQRKEIGLQDVYNAFKEKAIEYTTIPLSHDNNLLENTGYIKDLKIVDSKKNPGEKVLMAAHEFTEPEIKKKVSRGTIPSRSCGLLYDYKNTTTGKVYPIALDHVALTHKPWMGGMAPYGKEEFSDDRTIVPMFLSEKSVTIDDPVEKILPSKLSQEIDTTSHQENKKEESQSEFLADIVWGEKPSFRNIEKQVRSILEHMSGGDADDYPQYYLLDVTDDKVLVKVNYGVGPDEDAWVVPYEVDKNCDVHLAPFNEWVDSTRKWVTDTIDPEKDKEELDRLGMSDKTDLAVLTSKQRNKLSDSDFVYPSEKKYPIHDISHGRNALARVAQNGSPEEQAKVRAAVYKKYPELKKNKETSTKMSDPLKMASENRLGLSEQDKYSPLGGQMTLLMSEEQIERLGLEEGPAKEAFIKQNELLKQQSVELAEAKKAEKETSVANDISKFKEEGFDAFPGLLREYEVTALSDDGDIALRLQLSEHGHTTKVPETATEIAKRFMKAIPRKDGKVDLGEFANKLETPEIDRPELTPQDPNEKQQVKTGDDLLKQMLSDDPTLAKDPEFLALSENGKGK